jgi:2,4-dienoyl-CoA reductase-like NADH-dependent reductase (Old Yellow Enzyme family)
MAAVLPRAQRLGFSLVGPLIFRKYPYEEGYFLPIARRFRHALTLPLIYLGGVSTLDTVQRALGEGFDYVAMGRALVREPDLVNRMRDGAASASTCIHCNKCMVIR